VYISLRRNWLGYRLDIKSPSPGAKNLPPAKKKKRKLEYQIMCLRNKKKASA
jgi:hypothetical protein